MVQHFEQLTLLISVKIFKLLTHYVFLSINTVLLVIFLYFFKAFFLLVLLFNTYHTHTHTHTRSLSFSSETSVGYKLFDINKHSNRMKVVFPDLWSQFSRRMGAKSLLLISFYVWILFQIYLYICIKTWKPFLNFKLTASSLNIFFYMGELIHSK